MFRVVNLLSMSESESVDVVMVRTTKARQHHKSRGNVLMYILSSYRSGFLLNKLAHLVSKTKMLFSYAVLRFKVSQQDNSTNELSSGSHRVTLFTIS